MKVFASRAAAPAARAGAPEGRASPGARSGLRRCAPMHSLSGALAVGGFLAALAIIGAVTLGFAAPANPVFTQERMNP